MNRIRLVTFDALHTIITPRQPIYEQYSQVFAPYVGILPPESIKNAFKAALKTVQQEKPSYGGDAKSWWRDVIRRTAITAGAKEGDLERNLSTIVDQLMARFNSKEGYKAFDDAIPTIKRLHDQMGLKTAVISNGDARLRNVLTDLDFPDFLGPIVLSEEVGIEKPSRQIFLHALELVNRSLKSNEKVILPEECLHIGDELHCDYQGAVGSRFSALLVRRHGPLGAEEHKEPEETLENIQTIQTLDQIVSIIQK